MPVAVASQTNSRNRLHRRDDINEVTDDATTSSDVERLQTVEAWFG